MYHHLLKKSRLYLFSLMAILFLTVVSHAAEAKNAGNASVVAKPANPIQVAVTGVVTDETNQTLVGVTVTVKGTATATTTDASGKFTISAPDANATLVSLATPDTPHAQGQWVRRSITGEAPAGATRIVIYSYAAAGGTTRPAVGDTFDVTAYQITEGSTLYNYADGDSQNWAWSSTPNVSTSSGPPL